MLKWPTTAGCYDAQDIPRLQTTKINNKLTIRGTRYLIRRMDKPYPWHLWRPFFIVSDVGLSRDLASRQIIKSLYILYYNYFVHNMTTQCLIYEFNQTIYNKIRILRKLLALAIRDGVLLCLRCVYYVVCCVLYVVMFVGVCVLCLLLLLLLLRCYLLLCTQCLFYPRRPPRERSCTYGVNQNCVHILTTNHIYPKYVNPYHIPNIWTRLVFARYAHGFLRPPSCRATAGSSRSRRWYRRGRRSTSAPRECASDIYIYIYIYINIYSEANTSCIGIICLNDRERLCITGDDICYVGGGSGGNITDIGCWTTLTYVLPPHPIPTFGECFRCLDLRSPNVVNVSAFGIFDTHMWWTFQLLEASIP